MAWKNLKQLSLADSLKSEHEALTKLDDVNELIDWQAIEHLLYGIHTKRRGNTAWPPLFMFKALLLQKSPKHDEWLEDHPVGNKVIARAYRNTPLTPEQKKKNQRHSGTRCTVERVFGILKLHYGIGQARYLEFARIRFSVMCLAYNLRRGANINKCCATSHYSCA